MCLSGAFKGYSITRILRVHMHPDFVHTKAWTLQRCDSFGLRGQFCTRVHFRLDDSGRLVSLLRTSTRRYEYPEVWEAGHWPHNAGSVAVRHGLGRRRHGRRLLRYFPRLSRSSKTYLAINLH
ncbi:hypothetical protein BKA81DRAFT_217211 [Phyllosticta paracitricarpa]